eukprot:4552649-Pyramimonas_sp.AAC.1
MTGGRWQLQTKPGTLTNFAACMQIASPAKAWGASVPGTRFSLFRCEPNACVLVCAVRGGSSLNAAATSLGSWS